MCVRRWKFIFMSQRKGKHTAWEYDRKVKTQMKGTRTSSGACGIRRCIYQHLTCCRDLIRFWLAGRNTGAAWLSSAVSWDVVVATMQPLTLLPSLSWALWKNCQWRGGDRNPHGPYGWATTCYNGIYNRSKTAGQQT